MIYRVKISGKEYNDNYTYDTQKDGDFFGEIKEIIEEIEKGNIDTLELSKKQCRNRPRGGLAQAGNLATDETSRIYERMVDIMEFMEKLQKQKDEAKAAYIKARGEWWETRTAQNINGDFEKWKIVCDKKRDCMRLGVLIQASADGAEFRGSIPRLAFPHKRTIKIERWVYYETSCI